MRILLLSMFFIIIPGLLFATTDGIYQVAEVTAVWDGTDAVLPSNPTADYDAVFGDDVSLTYTLPASFSGFTFYRQSYSQITVDTNGNIWFGYSGSAYSFSLPSAGKVPVISAWNNTCHPMLPAVSSFTTKWTPSESSSNGRRKLIPMRETFC